VGHDEVQDDVEDRRIARQKAPSAPLEDGDGEERS
jgi:multicomponent Na+:H+ antiporter subunit C